MKQAFVLPLIFLGVTSHASIAMAQSTESFTVTGSMITPILAAGSAIAQTQGRGFTT